MQYIFYMFYGAIVFNGDISGWDVSVVTNMNYMFFNARAFNRDLEEWKYHLTLDDGKYTGAQLLTFWNSGVYNNKPSWSLAY